VAEIVERQILDFRLQHGPPKANFERVLSDLDHSTILAAIQVEQYLLNAR